MRLRYARHELRMLKVTRRVSLLFWGYDYVLRLWRVSGPQEPPEYIPNCAQAFALRPAYIPASSRILGVLFVKNVNKKPRCTLPSLLDTCYRSCVDIHTEWRRWK